MLIILLLFINQLPPTTWQPNKFALKKLGKVTKNLWNKRIKRKKCTAPTLNLFSTSSQ